MKIRIKFRKSGVMRFIGHLDIMRYFQKAIRRSSIDIAYSAGFSPHQIMSFAAPLGVGLLSDGEYMDIEVHTTFSSKEALRRLNAVMAEGMEVVSYRALPEGSKNAMSIVAAADYSIAPKGEGAFPFTYSEFLEMKKQFLVDRKEVMLTKQTKKSIIKMDVKPLIYAFSANENEKNGRIDSIFMKVATGSANNVKPEFILAAFYEFFGLDFKPMELQVTRKEVYADQGREEKHTFVSLEELGEEIAG